MKSRNAVQDRRGRPLRDLRISVIDRCNYRCPYCMPAELWVSCWRMAMMTEKTGSNEAAQWWRKAYQTLSAMKQRGRV